MSNMVSQCKESNNSTFSNVVMNVVMMAFCIFVGLHVLT